MAHPDQRLGGSSPPARGIDPVSGPPRGKKRGSNLGRIRGPSVIGKQGLEDVLTGRVRRGQVAEVWAGKRTAHDVGPPPLHEHAARVEHQGPIIGGFYLVSRLVGGAQLLDACRRIRALGRPSPERRPETVDGCVRLYPEDIVELYDLVTPGTPVAIVDQRVKAGWLGEELYLEVHPNPGVPTDEARPSMTDAVRAIIEATSDQTGPPPVDWERVRSALAAADGVPTAVGNRTAEPNLAGTRRGQPRQAPSSSS